MNLSADSDDNYPGASNQPAPHDLVSRRKAWEAGHIDYMGGDAYENIEKKLDESIAQTSEDKK